MREKTHFGNWEFTFRSYTAFSSLNQRCSFKPGSTCPHINFHIFQAWKLLGRMCAFTLPCLLTFSSFFLLFVPYFSLWWCLVLFLLHCIGTQEAAQGEALFNDDLFTQGGQCRNVSFLIESIPHSFIGHVLTCEILRRQNHTQLTSYNTTLQPSISCYQQMFL